MRIFNSCVLSVFVLTSLFPREYKLSNHPIDVVIPCHKKNADVLERSIEGIRSNGKNIDRIFVISKEKLTQKADGKVLFFSITVVSLITFLKMAFFTFFV